MTPSVDELRKWPVGFNHRRPVIEGRWEVIRGEPHQHTHTNCTLSALHPFSLPHHFPFTSSKKHHPPQPPNHKSSVLSALVLLILSLPHQNSPPPAPPLPTPLAYMNLVSAASFFLLFLLTACAAFHLTPLLLSPFPLPTSSIRVSASVSFHWMCAP